MNERHWERKQSTEGRMVHICSLAKRTDPEIPALEGLLRDSFLSSCNTSPPGQVKGDLEWSISGLLAPGPP